MDFGPLDMLQLMHTVYAIPPAPVEPVAPLPFVPGDFGDMWCRNPAGDKVEWWISYKVPAGTMTRGSSESVSNGIQYGYIDPATKLDSTVRMKFFDDITSTQNNALYNTLEVLFKYPKPFLIEKNLTYISYNDQPPAEVSTSSTNGISKGVLLFGNSSGAWISHTMPGFGHFFQEKYIFPSDARREAQTIFCMSLTSDNWPKIVAHLRRESPNIYDWNVPPALFESTPSLKELIEKNFNHEDPGAESNLLTGVNGTDFMAFSKNAVHNFDIYETLVAPQLETNIYVRGSQEGDQQLDNYCTDFNVTEVKDVELKLGQDISFKHIRRSQDNSRWAVAERDYWVCFGSVERRKSHLPRGGEVFCFQNQPANILMANSIEEFTKCKALPADIAAKIASAPAGTPVAIGSGGNTYIRPVVIRPSFGVPRVYYGGLPSFGIGFPFKKILKNPLVVGAAVAGVMHYRHKQQIKKLNQQHALAAGYGGFGGRGYPSYPSYGGSAGKYSSGLAGLIGGHSHHAPPPYHGGGYPTMGGSGYPSMGGYPSGGHGYPPPAYSPPSPGFNPGYGHANPGYPTQQGYPRPGAHGYPVPGYPSPSSGHPNPGYPTQSSGYPTQPKPAYPSAPGGSSYPTQPAYNPSYNAANTAAAPKPATAQNANKQQASNTRVTSARTGTSGGVSSRTKPARPIRTETTVTKTVTTYGSGNRGSNRGSSLSRGSSGSSYSRGSSGSRGRSSGRRGKG